MRPTPEQVGVAAYERWEKRGYGHGWHEADWLAAEALLRFRLNYEVVASDCLDNHYRGNLGDPRKRRCRFCGTAEPRVEFSEAAPALPEFLGGSSLRAHDRCDDCRELFREGVDGEFEAFARTLFDPHHHDPRAIPIGAFKGLVRWGLGMVPLRDLESYEDAIEWISNPDHDFDRNAFQTLCCTYYRLHGPFPAAWAILSRKTDEEEALPYMVFFLGFGDSILEIPLPLGSRDEDLDGHESEAFAYAPPAPFGLRFEPYRRISLPIAPESGTAETSRILPMRLNLP